MLQIIGHWTWCCAYPPLLLPPSPSQKRQAARQLLYLALNGQRPSDREAKRQAPLILNIPSDGEPPLAALARDVDNALHTHAGPVAYPARLRAVAANLRRSPALRAKVAGGALSPAALAALSPPELAAEGDQT